MTRALFISLVLTGSGACQDTLEATDLGVSLDTIADTANDMNDTAAPEDTSLAEPDTEDGAPGDTVTGQAETTEADTSPYPPLRFADVLLPLAADFDPEYVGAGDAVVTTLVETLRPPHGFVKHRTEDGALLTPADAVGRLVAQPGEPHLLRDQLAMPQDVTPFPHVPGQLPAGARSILYGFVLADPQLVDQDSPAQVPRNAAHVLEGIPLPAYTPQGELAVHANDALVRSANRFQTTRRYDVVVIAGDHVENSQANELGWLHTILNGGELTSDSGARDDVVPGPNNDAYDPFVAEGFLPGTPWISTIGNHDVNVNGNFPPGLVTALNADVAIRAKLDGLSGPLGLAFPLDPLDDASASLFPPEGRGAFRVQPEGFHPAMFPTDEELDALLPGPTPPDASRATLGPCGFVAATQAVGGAPVGHGFSAQNVSDCTGFYVYDPVPGVALRILSLDLGPVEGGDSGILAPPYLNGAPDLARVGDPRYDQVAFLDAELARAATEGVAIIVISHQSSDSVVKRSSLQDFKNLLTSAPELAALIDLWSPIPPVALDSLALRKKLSDSPNVIAHIAGHNHRNRVQAICADGTHRDGAGARCPTGAGGQTGYWEITTASGIDFPHQGRFVEVVYVGGQLGAIYTSVLDPRIPAGSFAERARFLSLAWEEVLKEGGGPRIGEITDRNLLLPIALPAAVAAHWAAQGHDALESETTLLDPMPPLPALPVWPAPPGG